MTKYLLNDTFHGYEKLDVKDISKAEEAGNLFVIIIDKTCDDSLSDYYMLVNSALKHQNRVIAISVMDENRLFRSLAALMVTYNDYDIYEVAEKEAISAEYLLKLENRTPDYSEVQTYIGGDVTAYSDMNMILFGIQSLAEEGNPEALKSFLEDHMLSIDNLTTSLNMMKKTCDLFNSNELVGEINNLKEHEKRLNKNLADKETALAEAKHDRDENKVAADTLKRENEKLKEKNKELQDNGGGSGDATIRSFRTVNTSMLAGNRAKIVLYFKEVSYVRYTNTLVSIIFEQIKLMKLKTKLLIYDTGSEMYNIYKPLRVVTGSDYFSEKTSLIKKVEKFVVAEPVQTIIEDILKSDEQFDVVIIYDRMHTNLDVVAGNLVTKFFVINSRDDYDRLKDQLKINDTSYIITNAESSINMGGKNNEWGPIGDRNFIDIPTIPEFKKKELNSSSFAISRYKRQAGTLTQKPIIDTIIEKSKINTLK
jgi:hypothetical protein